MAGHGPTFVFMSNFRFINFCVLRCYYVTAFQDIEGLWRRFLRRGLLEYSWLVTFVVTILFSSGPGRVLYLKSSQWLLVIPFRLLVFFVFFFSFYILSADVF